MKIIDNFRESEIEKKLVKMVKIRGGLARKYVSPGVRGVPDRIVIWPGGMIHFIELKSQKGKLSKFQIAERDRLSNLQCNFFTLYGIHGLQEYIEYIDQSDILEQIAI